MKIKPLTWPLLIMLFGVPAILNAIACKVVIPALSNSKLMPIEISYFLSVGLIVLAPMFIGSIGLSVWEAGSYKINSLFKRMRIKKSDRADTIWKTGIYVILFNTTKLLMDIYLIRIIP